MPHLSGVPIQSRALIAKLETARKRQDKITIAGRFGKIKNAKALAATQKIKRNTPQTTIGGVVRIKNRRVPRFG